MNLAVWFATSDAPLAHRRRLMALDHALAERYRLGLNAPSASDATPRVADHNRGKRVPSWWTGSDQVARDNAAALAAMSGRRT